MSRYLAPTVPIMTAVTGFDDRNMVNQCLLYRYLISYEPFNFKGRLTDFPDTVTYGQKMDTLRTELREWLWDATFRDTLGAEVIDVTDPARPVAHHPFSIYRQADGRQATVVANYDPDHEVRVRVVVAVNPPAALRYRFVDTAEWHTTTTDLTIPPRSAAVVLPDEALP